MVEQRTRTEEGGGSEKKLAMTSSSCANQSSMPFKESASKYYPYPSPLAKYEDVAASSKLFMATLEKLHATMGTKFMIPIVGGKELDLHRLFVEVTSRGGLKKIIQERRWKEVTAAFSFPSTATNASFVLRKYYLSLLHHYEQIYFFKAKGWNPVTADSLQSPSVPVPSQGLAEHALPSVETRATTIPRQRINTAEFPPAASPAPGSPVMGVIDGKFESGYLVTVTIGSEKLKGVLYQAPSQNPVQQLQQGHNIFSNDTDNTPPASGLQRRRRRKKSEIKKRDPSHPKPNRSGYNFFFAEQHARLKPLHPGKDREISRMIGELWTKLKETEKTVYQEKAMKDKERYRTEMEDYRERLRTGQIISDAVPIQQRLPDSDVNMVDVDVKTLETGGVYSFHTPGNESSSGKSDSEDDKTADKNLDEASSPGAGVGVESSNLGMGSLAEEEEAFKLRKRKRIKNVADDVPGGIKEKSVSINDFKDEPMKDGF